METLGTSRTLAEGASREARAPETETLEAPAKTLDPCTASVVGGGEESRVSELGLSSETPPAGAPDVGVEAVAVTVEVAGRPAMETLLVESHSCTSTEVAEEVEPEFPPYRSKEAFENRKSEENDVSDCGDRGTGEKEGDGGGGGEKELVGCVAENPFKVGDFVWGKVKNHPWLPGQVYDSSDATEYAKNVYRKDHHCILVAYFGNGTFAWCNPSQLKPFEENFEQMIGQSSLKSFIGAVREALNEIGRCLESEMTCFCVPADARARLGRPIAANAGIQEGVTVPDGRIGELSIAKYVPSELIERLHDIACDVSITNNLEVIMIRSWVSAFNRGKGRCLQLPAYHQNQENVDLVDIDINICSDASLGHPGMSTPTTGSGIAKGPEISQDKSSQRKKQRSMAELMAEMDMGMEEDICDGEEEVVIVGKRKKEVEKSPDAESGDAGGKESTGTGRRERKKSKYLSPPYTMMSGFSKRSFSPKDAETMWPKKYPEASQARDTAAMMGSPFPSSPRILKCNGEAIQDNKAFTFEEFSASADEMLTEFQTAALSPLYLRGNRSSPTVRGFFGRFRSLVYTNGSDYESYKRYLVSTHGIKEKTPGPETNGSEHLKPGGNGVESKSAGHETNGSQEDKSRAGVNINSPCHESNCSEEGKSGSGNKRKSLVHETNGPEGAKSRGTRKSVGRETIGSEEGKHGQKRRKKKRKGEANGDTGAALLLTFAPGIALPSKEEIISTFSKFGVLQESETELLKDSGCARLVFAKSSDAEKAINSSDRNRAFGPAVTNYQLRYLLQGNSSTHPPPIPKPPLQFVRKSLERMISALSESSPPGKYAASSDGLKPEARENLVDEMNGLLKKVNKLLVGSATATPITTTITTTNTT